MGKSWGLLGVKPLVQLIWSPPGRALDKLASEGSYREAALYPHRKSGLQGREGDSREEAESPVLRRAQALNEPSPGFEGAQ